MVGAKCASSRKSASLLQAVCQGKLGKVRLLLEQGVDPNIVDAEGDTLLDHTLWRGNTELLTLLLRHGACPQKRDSGNDTALQTAALFTGKRHRRACIDCLLECGVEFEHALHKRAFFGETCFLTGDPVDCCDSNGYTALHYACANGSLETVQADSSQCTA